MQITINLSLAKLSNLHAFLLISASFLELSLQSNVSGYICGDLVLWHDRVAEFAQLASELLKSSTVCRKFPALLENTQLFGGEDQVLFVVPCRIFSSIRSGGRNGQDRIVLDAFGNFKGVVYDTNNGNDNPMPAYRKCSPFIDYSHLELEKYIDDGYQISGIACGSNFIDRDIETKFHNKCVEYINSPPEMRSKHKFPERRFTRYHFEFNPQCRGLQVRKFSFKIQEQAPCLDVWSAEPSPDTITADSLFDLQSQNFRTSEEFYTCMQFTFRITSILNYVTYVLEMLRMNLSSSEHQIFKKHDNLLLWRIILPERRVLFPNYTFLYAIGIDEHNQFSGIYFVPTKQRSKKNVELCPDSNILTSRFLERGSS
ncbi:putative candidate secreted effector protein [Blumeria hordei DH14]|uniref:Putative candidate secreted effector protein n=1 Tax=Blumeria graminis f. sp. hordei (strain DH14) TaxID=546991 RepID=N1JBV5_BLUG1|nr:putative candidate secreted effector protein [Blumeria hordei DH14]